MRMKTSNVWLVVLFVAGVHLFVPACMTEHPTSSLEVLSPTSSGDDEYKDDGAPSSTSEVNDLPPGGGTCIGDCTSTAQCIERCHNEFADCFKISSTRSVCAL